MIMNKFRSRDYEINSNVPNFYNEPSQVFGNQAKFYQHSPFNKSEFTNFGSFSFDRDSFENPQFNQQIVTNNTPTNVSFSSSVFDSEAYKNVSLSTQHNSADYILPVRRLSDPNEKHNENFNSSYVNYHPKIIKKTKKKRLICLLTLIPIAIIIVVTIILVLVLQKKCKLFLL